MISDNARTAFDNLLSQNLRSALAGADDGCEVSVVPDLSGHTQTRIVALTISSYLFRLMVFIYFTPDESTREHFVRTNKMREAELSEQAFSDAISEAANMCCGALSRDLSQVFPNIGMSTPNMLDKGCATALAILKCGHVQHFKVDINNTERFHATLCISDYADLDFAVDTVAQEASTGELEMF